MLIDFYNFFVEAYRKLYNSQNILIRLIEERITQLDKNKIVGGVLLHLSKEQLFIIYLYLENRKQSVRLNNVYSTLSELISGVLQGSVLGAFLFNIFLNGLYLFITKASLDNYADDNTYFISAFI